MNRLSNTLGAIALCASIMCSAAHAAAGPEPDRTPPEIELSIDGGTLTATVSDRHSGVAAMYIGGEYFAGSAGTTLSIPLEAYAREEYIFIRATDYAGNESRVSVVKSPYYTGTAGTIVSDVTAFSIRPSTGAVTQGGEESVNNGGADYISSASGLKMYPVSCEVENGEAVYYYAVSLSEEPGNIPLGNVTIGDKEYSYSRTEIMDVFVANAEVVTEDVEIQSESTEAEDIAALLDQTLEYNKNGYSGILHLNLGSLGIEEGEQQTYSYTATQTREYPGLTQNDSSLIPKTLDYNGRAYALTDLSWTSTSSETIDYNQVPTGYTAHAVYSSTGVGTKILDYNVTAQYSGTVTNLEAIGQVHAVHFSEVEAEAPATVDEEKSDYSGIISVAGAAGLGVLIIAAAYFIKKGRK